MYCFYILQCLLDQFFGEEFTECIEDDSITDTEEEMKRGRNDTIRIDGEERRMSAIDGMLVCRSAITRGGEEILMRDDADWTWVCSSRSHEAEYGIDEAPITVEEGSAFVYQVLQHLPYVMESSGVASEWC